MNKKTIASFFIGTTILLLSLATNAASQSFNEIFVVGDSLSDTGNVFNLLGGTTTQPPYNELIPSAAYSSKRLSNGPVWVEYLASKLGTSVQASLTGGTGYAFGGARTGPLSGLGASPTPTLIEQAQTLIDLPGVLQSDALYVVWGGGNDVQDAVATADPTQAGLILQDSLNNIGGVISSLAGEGATQFLVLNLPNLGLTPAAQAAGPLAAGFFSQLSDGFNDGLSSLVIPELETGLGVTITELDVKGLSDNVFATPSDFGLENVVDHCIILGGGSCTNPEDYLFWDGIHPTTAAHALIGDQAFAALVPIPAALPLFITAFSMLGFFFHRRTNRQS